MSTYTKRIIMSIFGVVICGLSVGMFKHAAFGVDPFQALMSGLDAVIPIRFGTLYVIVNLLLLVFSLVMDRRKIGHATFINLFLLGYVVEFSQAQCEKLFPAIGIGGRVLLLLTGLVILSLASALYFTADLGVSTYDAVAIVMSKKWKWGKFKYIRICTDLVCVVAGAVLFVAAGNPIGRIPTIVGIGTIVTAFFMGPLIDLFHSKIARPLLGKEGK